MTAEGVLFALYVKCRKKHEKSYAPGQGHRAELHRLWQYLDAQCVIPAKLRGHYVWEAFGLWQNMNPGKTPVPPWSWLRSMWLHSKYVEEHLPDFFDTDLLRGEMDRGGYQDVDVWTVAHAMRIERDHNASKQEMGAPDMHAVIEAGRDGSEADKQHLQACLDHMRPWFGRVPRRVPEDLVRLVLDADDPDIVRKIEVLSV
jgi:hypothetical protein